MRGFLAFIDHEFSPWGFLEGNNKNRAFVRFFQRHFTLMFISFKSSFPFAKIRKS